MIGHWQPLCNQWPHIFQQVYKFCEHWRGLAAPQTPMHSARHRPPEFPRWMSPNRRPYRPSKCTMRIGHIVHIICLYFMMISLPICIILMFPDSDPSELLEARKSNSNRAKKLSKVIRTCTHSSNPLVSQRDYHGVTRRCIFFSACSHNIFSAESFAWCLLYMMSQWQPVCNPWSRISGQRIINYLKILRPIRCLATPQIPQPFVLNGAKPETIVHILWPVATVHALWP